MKKYEVTLYFHTSITVEVEAKNEEDAIANAYAVVGDSKYDEQVLNNTQEDGRPDVEEVEE